MMAPLSEMVPAVALGLGLAAACGFRVFVPLFALGVAGARGQLALAPDMQWATTTPALVALGTATVLEIAAYYIPWLDHALDLLASPAAVLAGVVASAAVLVDVPPLLRWGTALVAGGGAAAVVQGATVLLRAKSGLLTGGTANPAVATAELGGAVGLTLAALVLPFLALAAVVALVVWRLVRRRRAA